MSEVMSVYDLQTLCVTCEKPAMVGNRQCKKCYKEGIRMPTGSLYAHGKSEKLTKLLAQASRGTEDTLRMEEEITVARALLDRAIHTFDVTCVSLPTDPEKAKLITPTLQIRAQQNLKQALDQVSKLNKEYAAILAVSDITFNSRQVDMIMDQVTRAVIKHLQDFDPVRADKILEDISKIRLTSKQQNIAGTGSTVSGGSALKQIPGNFNLEFEEDKTERLRDVEGLT